MSSPVMFISHGSPMFSVETGRAGLLLNEQSACFDHCRAILILSPHWITNGTKLSSASKLETIHDFGGFPSELYEIEYPATGDVNCAEEIKTCLKSVGISAVSDDNHGLDHGAWVPLIHLRPDADIPIIQVSLDQSHSLSSLYEMGQALAPLKEKGIAIIGSGGITHNLFDIRRGSEQVAPYASRFQEWVRGKVRARALGQIMNPQEYTNDFKRAHPTAEHYAPLLFALGASEGSEEPLVLESEILNYAISMESYIWK